MNNNRCWYQDCNKELELIGSTVGGIKIADLRFDTQVCKKHTQYLFKVFALVKKAEDGGHLSLDDNN